MPGVVTKAWLTRSTNGARAWILLIKSAMAFLLTSGILKLISGFVLQFITLNADPEEEEAKSEEIEDTAQAITSAAQSPESMENLAS